MGEQRAEERFRGALRVKLEQGEGVVRNVSATGIYFVTDVALKAGQPVEFTLEFQSTEAGPTSANCIARIVRVEKKRGRMKGVAASIDSIKFYRTSKQP